MIGVGRKITDEDIQLVQNCIERCLQHYMDKMQCINTLARQRNIHPHFTEIVWDRLDEENEKYFGNYYSELWVKGPKQEVKRLLSDNNPENQLTKSLSTIEENEKSMEQKRRKMETPADDQEPMPAELTPEFADDQEPMPAELTPEFADDQEPMPAELPPEFADDQEPMPAELPPEFADDQEPMPAELPPELADDQEPLPAELPPEFADDQEPMPAELPPEFADDQEPMPAELPPEFVQEIERRTGTRPVFLYEKRLEPSDVKPQQNRLFMTNSGTFMDFMTVEEKKKHKKAKDLTILVEDLKGELYELHLAKWSSLKFPILKYQWRKLIENNNVKEHDWVELWGYRHNSALRLVVKFRKP